VKRAPPLATASTPLTLTPAFYARFSYTEAGERDGSSRKEGQLVPALRFAGCPDSCGRVSACSHRALCVWSRACCGEYGPWYHGRITDAAQADSAQSASTHRCRRPRCRSSRSPGRGRVSSRITPPAAADGGCRASTIEGPQSVRPTKIAKAVRAKGGRPTRGVVTVAVGTGSTASAKIAWRLCQETIRSRVGPV
jgi:hypothetical protein